MLLFLSFVLSLFIFKGWYVKQYNKGVGFHYVNKGDNAYRNRKYQKAVDFYRAALSHYPEHSGASCNLGNIYVSFENYYEAVNAYENALKYSPDYISCRMDLGIILAEKMADYDRAIQEYGKIINTNSNGIDIQLVYNNKKTTKINKGRAYYNMGLAYRGKAVYMGDRSAFAIKYLEKARESYLEALKYLENDFDTYYNLALTEHLLGDYNDASKNYCNAININPENFEAHYNFALLLRTMRKNKEALAEFEKSTMLIDASTRENKDTYIFGIMSEIKRRILNEGGHEYLLQRIDLTSVPAEDIVYSQGKVMLSKQKEVNMKEFLKCKYTEEPEEK